jgi:SNF2 family DNA or RNA helicase
MRVRPDKVAMLRGIFPTHSRVVNHQGADMLALPHSLAVVKVLRNMGIKAPSPIRYYYDWPRPARFDKVFDHQYTTADFLTLHPKCFVLNEMGTNKTSSALWAADYLMKIGKVKKVLIACTMSTMEMVWLNEIFDVCMHRTALVLHSDADKRKEMLARDVDFYIINHAGINIIAKELIARKDIDLVIVDEASVYRNAQTKQYETLERVVRDKKLWLLTGAPAPNAPTDVWALARLVNKALVPPHFTSFKRKTMSQISTYKWVPRPGSHEVAYAALQPAIRFRKKDCLTLPPVTFTSRKCELEPEQIRAYADMKTHLVAEAQAQQITAVNAADKISKLRQILCGAIKGADGQYILLPHGKRLKILQEYIEQAAAKVLVIVPFKGIARVLEEELQHWHDDKGDGRRVKLVNGDVSMTERNRIFQDFRDDPALTELVCHPAVMAHGLNMTQADMVVFYAPIYSNDQSAQVMDRINRPGQKLHMTVGRIIASPLEQAIYAMVEGRQQSQMNMLELFRKEMQV